MLTKYFIIPLRSIKVADLLFNAIFQCTKRPPELLSQCACAVLLSPEVPVGNSYLLNVLPYYRKV